jgi:hypothetical protein
MDKKRIIVDYKNVTNEILDALNNAYPNGYEGKVIKFKNAKGETISAVPVETEDSNYLVKISAQLESKMEAYLNDEEEDDFDAPTAAEFTRNAAPEIEIPMDEDDEEEEDTYDTPDDDEEEDEEII